MDQSAYTVVAPSEDANAELTPSELRAILQKADDEIKLHTLRNIIVNSLNGHAQPTLLMPIIQYVLPSKNKQIKKMLHFYWEVCPKYDEKGELKQEMILVVNAIRNDLQHPNEYIRGSTLRFLQKIKEPELLEPLIPSIRACLEHRHSYVRKNAVFCIYAIYQHHESIISDAPEIMLTFLAAEADSTCKRNAFVLLSHAAPEKAIDYIMDIFETIPNMDELMQLAVIELIRKESKGDSPHRTKYIRAISELLSAPSHAVKYESAITLTTLTQNAAATKATAGALIDLAVKESDNNVKLIVLSRLDVLRAKHEHVMDPLVMDLLRVLSSPDMDVRRKALAIALQMVSSRNVEEVVLFMRKELLKTTSGDASNANVSSEKNIEYRQLLIQSIHQCAIKFSEVASNVVHTLMEFLGDSANPSNASAVDVIVFVREVVEKFPDLRPTIITKLLSILPQIKSGKVFRGALWILGEYCETSESIEQTLTHIRQILGEVPILAAEERLLREEEHKEEQELQSHQGTNGDLLGDSKPAPTSSSSTRVRADGTYATETAFDSEANAAARLEAVKNATKPPLRALILLGDFYTAASFGSSLTKLILRLYKLSDVDSGRRNERRAEAMLQLTSIIRVGQSKFTATQIDEDSTERITECIESLAQLGVSEAAESSAATEEVFLHDTKAAYAKMVEAEERKNAEKKAKESKIKQVQPDDVISFRQLAKKSAAEAEAEDAERELTQATGLAEKAKEDFVGKLKRVVQLTGFSDSVYAEAYVNVQQFDILLDVLVVNQTSATLQNLGIEFATLGDLKLVERPSSCTLGPYAFQSIKATIKVSSTETGVIFGNIIYEATEKGQKTSTAAPESACVVLNDIHVDIMDYIKPSMCTETQFRSMWTEFEWENKVNVNTPLRDLRRYLQHLMRSTNMACLTPSASLAGECGFLSANLYARSLFGEDALANVSIEQMDDGTVQGHVRIRAKTQGIALSLGDRITLAQKGGSKGSSNGAVNGLSQEGAANGQQAGDEDEDELQDTHGLDEAQLEMLRL
ncbi:unnamed protein product [Sympodiomycopsis kandeliae]